MVARGRDPIRTPPAAHPPWRGRRPLALVPRRCALRLALIVARARSQGRREWPLALSVARAHLPPRARLLGGGVAACVESGGREPLAKPRFGVG